MTKEEIKKALEACPSFGTFCENCPYHMVRNCSDTLKTDARSLIIEQENEIEKLKNEFKQLETNAEILARGVRDLNHENYELTEKVKQAKIDVLNKLKDYVNQLACDEYGDSACDTNYITIDIDKYEQDIDEMIAEVQNGGDKC